MKTQVNISQPYPICKLGFLKLGYLLYKAAFVFEWLVLNMSRKQETMLEKASYKEKIFKTHNKKILLLSYFFLMRMTILINCFHLML